MPIPLLESASRGRAHPDAPIGEHHKAAKIHPATSRKKPVFIGVHLQSKLLYNPLFDLPPPLPKLFFIPAEQEKIIHIPDITLAPEFMFHKMIQRIQIDIRPELARQIADRQPSPRVPHRKQIHAPNSARSIGMAGKNPLHQHKQALITNHLGEKLRENCVVDMGKIFADIALQGIREGSGELRRAAHSSVGALAGAAGETVFNEPGLEKWLHHPHHGMMHHAVAKLRRCHQSFFRLINPEIVITAMPVGSSQQLSAQSNQFLFQIRKKTGGGHLSPFPAHRGISRRMKIFKRTDLFKKMLMPLHRFALQNVE